MKYEIRYYYRPSEDPVEVTATLDHACIRAKKHSLNKEELGALFVIVAIDGKRTVRAFAESGRLYWAKECKECKGTGMYRRTKCYDCEATGGVPDRTSTVAA